MSDPMQADVEQRIVEIAAKQAGMRPAEVSPASRFVDDLKYDSLTVVEFTMEVEDEFEMSIPDEEVQHLQTVGSVIEYVRKRVEDVPPVKA